MDENRRLVHRREPIEVVFDDETKFEVKPLPWQKRNDLGSQLVHDNVEQTNKQLRMFVDPELSVPQIEAQLNEPLSDYPKFLILGLTEYDRKGKATSAPKREEFDNFTFGELVELLSAILEVNELQKLKRLIDPNFQAPTESSGETSSAGMETIQALDRLIGAKTPSLPDSSSSDSEETTSSSSPTEK